MLSSYGSVISLSFLSFQGYCFSTHLECAFTSFSCDQLVSHIAALYDTQLLAILDGYQHVERNIREATENLASHLMKKHAKKCANITKVMNYPLPTRHQ